MKSALRFVLLAGALVAAAPASSAAETAPAASSAASAAAATLAFDGVGYVHRWSKAGQNEFTPPSQTDLDHRDDMVTLLVYERVTTQEQLAQVASRILANYKRDGLVLRTRAIPGTAEHATEYLVVGVLPGGGIDEIVCTRLVMTDGIGEALMVAHRFYGQDKHRLSEQTADWLQANGPRIEPALLAWRDVPPVGALRTLPQAP